MDGEKFREMNDERQDKQLEQLNGTLNQISMDIREIMTTLAHYERKFDDAQREISELDETSKDNAHEVSKLNLKINTIESDKRSLTDRVSNLEDNLQERDKKSDADRKWLVGTVIAVIGLAATVLSLII